MFEYILSWVYGCCNTLYDYLFITMEEDGEFRNIGRVENLLDDKDYNEFKKDGVQLKKTTYALNNIPNNVHSALFSDMDDVSSNYYQMIINRGELTSYDLTNFSDDMTNPNLR